MTSRPDAPGPPEDPIPLLGRQLLDEGSTDHQVSKAIALALRDYNAPLRVGILGRVSSGKSTLVNALLGRRVAATAAEDSTHYPVVYAYGAPEGAVAVHLDGTRTPVDGLAGPVRRSALGATHLGDDVIRVEVTLQSASLAGMTLIDTPGLSATIADDVRTRTVHRLVASADVLVYLFRGTARTDDVGVLGDFAAQAGSSGRAEWGQKRTIGVLSHADSYGTGGWGSDDPIELAAEAAERTRQLVGGRFDAVVPISGLMAESVRTGAVAEADCRSLRELKDADLELLRFAATVSMPGIDSTMIARLTGLLTPLGVNRGRAHAVTSPDLAEWLMQVSGVRRLESALVDATVTVSHARTARAMDEFTAVARRPEAPRSWAGIVEAVAYQPETHVVRELRIEQRLTIEAPASPFLTALRDLLRYATLADRRAAIPPGQDALAWCLGQASRHQAASGSARSSLEGEAARVLAQSMLHLAQTVQETRS